MKERMPEKMFYGTQVGETSVRKDKPQENKLHGGSGKEMK